MIKIMKNLVVLFLFMGFMACDSASDMKTVNMENEQAKDTTSVSEQEFGNDGEISAFFLADPTVSILFTDSCNVSVFERRGKGWKKEDMKVSYMIQGKKYTPPYSYVEGNIPYDGDINYYFFESRVYQDDNPDKPKLWLRVYMYIFEKSEFNTTLLTFPDGSVDTIVGQRYMPVTPQSGFKKIWYNGEQVLSWDLYSNEPLGTYPDGSFIHRGGEFQIIKE
jgi:hypothetical protein